jgi:hypothetical protein
MAGLNALGKKVFFLYPPPVLSEIVDELARREFEVFLVRDHVRLRNVLKNNPEALVFIDIDDGLEEAAWARYIEELRNDPATAAVRIGIITLNDRPAEVKQTYLMDLQVACGFIVLKIGAAKTIEILVKTLEANEARGQRRFVRAICPPGVGTCVPEFEGATLSAELSDLSSAGMTIHFEGTIHMKAGTVLRDLVLTVKGVRFNPSGFVVGVRADAGGRNIYVVMFAPESIDDTHREKLKTVVRYINQNAIDEVLARS